MHAARVGVSIGIGLALASLASLTACERESQHDDRFEHHDLPGFSLDLPAGTTYGTPSLDYPIGSLAIKGTHEVSLVEWSATGKLEGDELQIAVAALGSIVHATKPGAVTTRMIAGVPVDTMRFASDRDGDAMLVSQIPCGHRNIVLATVAVGGTAAEPHHQHVLDSVVCKPDAAREAALASTRLEIHVDLPGFGALSRDANQLALTDGSSFLLLEPMVAMTDDRLLDAIDAVLSGAFKDAIKAGARRGDMVPLSGKLDGDAVVGWATLIPCPHSKTLALDLSPTDAAATTIATAVAAATCLPPDAPAQIWPDAPQPSAAP